MNPPFTPAEIPLLVFTDLDGTLLDHDTYSFAPAAPALARLKELNVPLIPTTSKTLAELAVLKRALDNPHPCIVENGCAVCLPTDYFDNLIDAQRDGEQLIVRSGTDYDGVLAQLHRLREEEGYHFRGFHDMSDAEVAADTGLSPDDATRARQRLCSEPLVWQDSLRALARFEKQVESLGLHLTRGGRYWHAKSGDDKAQAMQRLRALYEQQGGVRYTTVALGDSPNDEAMLRAADVAVIVRRPDGTHLDGEGMKRVIRTEQPGPVGWNAAMLQLIEELRAAPRVQPLTTRIP